MVLFFFCMFLRITEFGSRRALDGGATHIAVAFVWRLRTHYIGVWDCYLVCDLFFFLKKNPLISCWHRPQNTCLLVNSHRDRWKYA